MQYYCEDYFIRNPLLEKSSSKLNLMAHRLWFQKENPFIFFAFETFLHVCKLQGWVVLIISCC